MAYSKTTWTDRNVQYPTRYTITKSGGGAISSADDVTMTASAGTVTEAGTAINATKMNNIETGIEEAHEMIETATTTSDSDTSEIIVPSGVVAGELVHEVNGNSVINILPDAVAGCESNSGWTASSGSIATDSSNEFEGTNCLKATLGAASDTYDYNIFSLLTAGKYYFLSGHVKNGDATNITLSFESDDQDVSASAVTATTYNRVGVVIAPTDFDTATYGYIRLTVTGSASEYAFVDALELIEITSTEYALGADALLTKYAWHLDLAHTNKTRVLSECKNIMPNMDYLKGYYTSGLVYTPSGTYVTIPNVKLQAGTYKLSCNGSKSIYLSALQNAKSGVSAAGVVGNLPYTMTVPLDGLYHITLRNQAGTAWAYGITSNDDELQLELGSTATTYEAYKSSQAICPVTLRSVSDAIKDTFQSNTGKHVQNCGVDEDISDTQYDSQDNSTYTNVDVIKTTAFSDMIAQTTSADGTTKVINSSGQILEEVAAADIDLVASVGKYYTHTDETIWFIVAAGTYADIAAARTGLGTSKAIYQLAEPITTYYPSSALVAYESGRIVVEPFVEETYIYDSGITVNASYPISSLAYVYKVDIDDDTETPIAISDCTVATGGASISSITDALDGEHYKVGYRYTGLSTIATSDYTHPSDGIKASVNGLLGMVSTLNKKVDELQTALNVLEDKTYHVGKIINVAYNTPPENSLECDGSAISRTTYARLFAKIGTTWGVGDGSTTFNIPDARGEFFRGWDNGKGTDSGRAFASSQSGAIEAHSHDVYSTDTNSANCYGMGDADGDFGLGGANGGTGGYYTNDNNSHQLIEDTGGTETRPRNLASLYAIVY